MLFRFGEYSLDTDRRELARSGDLVAVEPQIFDLPVYLIRTAIPRRDAGFLAG